MNLGWGHDERAGQEGQLARHLPGAVGFADLAAVARVLAGPAGGAYDAACWSLFNVWYLPPGVLQVVYRVSPPAGAPRLLLVRYGRPGAGARAGAAAVAAPAFAVPEWNACVWDFRDDPDLPAQRALLDLPAVATRLEQAGVALAGDQVPEVMSYLPGERLVVRYAAADGPGAIGKLQAGTELVQEAALALWSSADRAFGMPRPLAADASAAARWETFAAGARVSPAAVLRAPELALSPVLNAVADLHRRWLPGLRSTGREALLRLIQRKIGKRIAAAVPEHAELAGALVGELQACAAGLPPPAAGLIHGDLHTANVLLDGPKAVLIDLDSLARGEPAFDLALLGTRLLLELELAGLDVRPAARLVADLPRLYRAAGGVEVPAQVYAWYVAAVLVGRQLRTCIRHLAPELSRRAEWMLLAAQAVLAAGGVQAELLLPPARKSEGAARQPLRFPR